MDKYLQQLKLYGFQTHILPYIFFNYWRNQFHRCVLIMAATPDPEESFIELNTLRPRIADIKSSNTKANMEIVAHLVHFQRGAESWYQLFRGHKIKCFNCNICLGHIAKDNPEGMKLRGGGGQRRQESLSKCKIASQ